MDLSYLVEYIMIEGVETFDFSLLSRETSSKLRESLVERYLDSGDLSVVMKFYPEGLDNKVLLNRMGDLYLERNDLDAARDCYSKSFNVLGLCAIAKEYWYRGVESKETDFFIKAGTILMTAYNHYKLKDRPIPHSLRDDNFLREFNIYKQESMELNFGLMAIGKVLVGVNNYRAFQFFSLTDDTQGLIDLARMLFNTDKSLALSCIQKTRNLKALSQIGCIALKDDIPLAMDCFRRAKLNDLASFINPEHRILVK